MRRKKSPGDERQGWSLDREQELKKVGTACWDLSLISIKSPPGPGSPELGLRYPWPECVGGARGQHLATAAVVGNGALLGWAEMGKQLIGMDGVRCFISSTPAKLRSAPSRGRNTTHEGRGYRHRVSRSPGRRNPICMARPWLKTPSREERLPPRSPELNSQENIWQFMRQNWLSNRIFTISSITAATPGTHSSSALEDHVHRTARLGRRRSAILRIGINRLIFLTGLGLLLPAGMSCRTQPVRAFVFPGVLCSAGGRTNRPTDVPAALFKYVLSSPRRALSGLPFRK